MELAAQQQQHAAAQAEIAALTQRLARAEASPPPAKASPSPAEDKNGIGRRSSEEAACDEAALGGSESLLPSAALCALLELHPGKQHQPMACRDLVALLLDAGHLQLAAARRGARSRWQAALRPAIALGSAVTDPWLEYNVHKQQTELAVRWDYDPATGAWVSSETLIKMERAPFAHGAMRECFRMKKMSQVTSSFFFTMNWVHCNNYVAKRYMKEHGAAHGAAADPLDSSIYFDDIKMQVTRGYSPGTCGDSPGTCGYSPGTCGYSPGTCGDSPWHMRLQPRHMR